jgi:ribosomal protein S12 methylthiotransferase accessory factor
MNMEISFSGGKKVDATYNGFCVQTDQPVNEGGSGSSPSPFDLFLVSIGTCTGFYVLSFCQRNNIPTDALRLRASFQMNPESHLIENVHIDIHVPKEFPEKYKNAVVKAAGLCTVKRNLKHPPEIEIQLIASS